MNLLARKVLLLLGAAIAIQAQTKTRNIIFVMTDGLRWQEVFGGADPALLNKEDGGVPEPEKLRAEFWRADSKDRRSVLMPFLWNVVARQGQLYGNRELQSDAYVTNGFNFSYPGYNETLTGFPDPRIDSNDKRPNPNVTVLEWLHGKPTYRGRVAAFGAWDVFPFIFNVERARFPVNAAHAPLMDPPITPSIALLNLLKAETRVWESEAYDSLMFRTALEYFRQHKPRVIYISLGDTDEWAHDGKYHLYLQAAHRADQYVRELWEAAQAIPEYRGSTTLIFSTDHGRGSAPVEWKKHGQQVPESRYMWMGFLGPDTPALGERHNIEPVTQSQIAATLARVLGEDYNSYMPKAALPVADAINR